MSHPTVLIVNPKARGGWLGRKWPTLEPALREHLGAFTVRMTGCTGHGTALCQKALSDGARLVIAVGGDGTASEVAAGFMLHGKVEGDAPCFGFLPCGSGGDLRRTCGMPGNLIAAARALSAAAPRRIDMGRYECLSHEGQPLTGYFINIGGFGIGGALDMLVNRSKKLLGGSVTFAVATVRASLRYRNALVRMRLDDGPEREVRIYNVAIANGQYFGGGMHIAPEARLDDGLFDVVTLGDLSLPEVILRGHTIYRGVHIGTPKVDAARARKVTASPVDPNEKVLLEIDGEAPGRLPATFTVVPGALWIRA